MSFVMGVEATKKVKFLDQDGAETLEHDDAYAFIRYEAAGAPPRRKRRKPDPLPDEPPDSKPMDADSDEKSDYKPDPGAAIAALTAAQGELAVIVDLLANVAGQQALAVQFVDGGRSAQEAWAENALASARCRARLRAGASRLREAASQLREEAEEGNAFVRDLAQLQAFWRLHHTAEASRPVFHVLLAFPAALAPDRVAVRGKPAPPLPLLEHIRLSAGLSGAVVTSVPLPERTPTVQGAAAGSAQPSAEAIVAIGAQQVHAFLLDRLRSLVWRSATARARFELEHASAVLFVRHATETVCAALPWGAPAAIGAAAAAALPPPPPRLRAFRPLLCGVMLTQLVPGRRVTADAVLLPALLAALRQQYLSGQIRQSLHEQVLRHPSASLHTVCQAGTACFSATLRCQRYGDILVAYHSLGHQRDLIAARFLPAGPVLETAGAGRSGCIAADVSLADLELLTERFWGLPLPPPDGGNL